MNNHVSHWGPAKHDPDHPLHRHLADPDDNPLQVALDRRDHRVGVDQRDEDVQRPDDN